MQHPEQLKWSGREVRRIISAYNPHLFIFSLCWVLLLIGGSATFAHFHLQCIFPEGWWLIFIAIFRTVCMLSLFDRWRNWGRKVRKLRHLSKAEEGVLWELRWRGGQIDLSKVHFTAALRVKRGKVAQHMVLSKSQERVHNCYLLPRNIPKKEIRFIWHELFLLSFLPKGFTYILNFFFFSSLVCGFLSVIFFFLLTNKNFQKNNHYAIFLFHKINKNT